MIVDSFHNGFKLIMKNIEELPNSLKLCYSSSVLQFLKTCKQEQHIYRNTKNMFQELSTHQMIVCTFRNYFTLDNIAKLSETLLILAVLEKLNFVRKSNIRKEEWKMHSSLNFQIWNRVRAACKQFFFRPTYFFKTDIHTQDEKKCRICNLEVLLSKWKWK